MSRMKLTSLSKCRRLLDEPQGCTPSQRKWGLHQVLYVAHLVAVTCPRERAPWSLRASLNTNRPLVTYKPFLAVSKEGSDVPVWLRMQLWESIPDPHYDKIAILLTSADEEDLQLLIRPLSIDIGAWAGQRSCITTFP